MNNQIDILGTISDISLNDNILRDLLDIEVNLIGGGEVQANGY